MRLVPLFATARARFILREGLFRRGSIVGLLMAGAYAVLNRDDASVASSWWHLGALVGLCFVEWTIGAGWLIGAAMWSRRERSTRSSVWPRSSPPGKPKS